MPARAGQPIFSPAGCDGRAGAEFSIHVMVTDVLDRWASRLALDPFPLGRAPQQDHGGAPQAHGAQARLA